MTEFTRVPGHTFAGPIVSGPDGHTWTCTCKETGTNPSLFGAREDFRIHRQHVRTAALLLPRGDRERLGATARSRAVVRVARNHPEEFAEALTAERAALGLPPQRPPRNPAGARRTVSI
jgi:hypothetical protein